MPVTPRPSLFRAKPTEVPKAFADLLVVGPGGDVAGGRAKVEMEDDPESPTASLRREGGRNRREEGVGEWP